VANFRNYTFLQAVMQPEKTTVVGDIERWAELYLDSGQHLVEWDQKIVAMRKRFDDENARPDTMRFSTFH